MLALTVLAPFAVAGCGDRFGPGSEQASVAEALPKEAPPLPPPTSTTPPTTPASSTPTTPPPTTASDAVSLGEVENVGGVIWQPRALYDGQVQIGVRDGYVAAVVPRDATTGELRVSAEGEPPAPARGAGALPVWARPHVGTDVTGRTVVTYPRCTDPTAVGTCDIHQWTAATQREQVLRGVSGGALAETEAVMDFGTVLVVREKRPVLTADELQHETPPLTTLLLKPRGRPLRVVTRHGGRDIDLRGSRIADVFTTKAAQGTSCSTYAARALNLQGLTIARRDVACGETGTTRPVGPSVAGNHLRFGIVTVGEPGSALDHDLGTGRTRSTKLTRPTDWWTADGERSGYALDTVGGAGFCWPVKARAEAETDARCRLSRSAKLVWKPVASRWTVAGGDTPVRD